jgi:hypothetical protein
MTLSRRAWLAYGAGTLAAGLGSAALWQRFRPMPQPVWEAVLDSRGARFRTLPGKPEVSVCPLLLEVQYGMRGRSTRPALLVRNAGGGMRLDRVEFVASDTIVETWLPQSSGPPGEWNRLRPASRGASIPGRAYVLVLCDAHPNADAQGDRATGARMVVDAATLAMDGVDVATIDGQSTGLVPDFFAA